MSSLVIYDLKGAESDNIEIDDKLLNEPLRSHLIKEVVVAHLAKLRQGTHSTKGTSEVTASTRKLYRQKGTGNARAGSAKAVQRRHGATQFGPKPRDYSLKVNKKVARSALISAFAEAVRQEKLTIVDSMVLDTVKSRQVAEILAKWKVKNALMVEDNDFNDNFAKSARNFKTLKLVPQAWLNVYDLLKYHRIFMTKEAVKSFTARFL